MLGNSTLIVYFIGGSWGCLIGLKCVFVANFGIFFDEIFRGDEI